MNIRRPILSDLFGDITLSTVKMGNDIFPVLGILGINPINVNSLDDGDFFILEKYEIPMTDEASILLINDIIDTQTISRYMYSPPENIWKPVTIYTADSPASVVNYNGQDYTCIVSHVSSRMAGGISGFVIDYNLGRWALSVTASIVNDVTYQDYPIWVSRDIEYSGDTEISNEPMEYHIGDIVNVVNSNADLGLYISLTDHIAEYNNPQGLFDDFEIDYIGGNWEKYSGDEYTETPVDDYDITKSLYMTEIEYMSDNALDYSPTYIDIQKYFENGLPYIIDNNTDIELNKYIYRVKTKYRGEEYVSSYIAGVHVISFDSFDSGNIGVNDDIILKGNLQTNSTSGIIFKGLPIFVPSPRMNGPIEAEKERAFYMGIDQMLGGIEEIIGWVDSSTDLLTAEADNALNEINIMAVQI